MCWLDEIFFFTNILILIFIPYFTTNLNTNYICNYKMCTKKTNITWFRYLHQPSILIIITSFCSFKYQFSRIIVYLN